MNNLIILLVVAAIGLVAFYYKDTIMNYFSKKQGYANVSDLDGVGSLDNMAPPLNPNEISDALSFAELVDDSTSASYKMVASVGAMDKLSETMKSMELPKSARHVTPYNIDVADPKAFSYMASLPRVTIKPRTYEDADPYRGDIPIRFNPNIALVTKSQFGEDSQKTDAMFSDSTLEAAARLRQNSYKNTPIQMSLGGTIGDYTQ